MKRERAASYMYCEYGDNLSNYNARLNFKLTDSVILRWWHPFELHTELQTWLQADEWRDDHCSWRKTSDVMRKCVTGTSSGIKLSAPNTAHFLSANCLVGFMRLYDVWRWMQALIFDMDVHTLYYYMTILLSY